MLGVKQQPRNKRLPSIWFRGGINEEALRSDFLLWHVSRGFGEIPLWLNLFQGIATNAIHLHGTS